MDAINTRYYMNIYYLCIYQNDIIMLRSIIKTVSAVHNIGTSTLHFTNIEYRIEFN